MKKILKKIIPKKILNVRHLFFAWLGSIIYKHPSEKLIVIGVTGTSGKSTTVYIMRNILEQLGFTVGSLSTIDFSIAGKNKLNDQKMTMLGKMQIQKYLREMVDAGCDIAIVETTSEGALQHRHRFINYDMILITNLYPEHIESHGGFDNYKKAKQSIVKYVSKCKTKKLEHLKISKSALQKIGRVPKTRIVNANSKYAKDFMEPAFDQNIYVGRDDKNIYLSSKKDNSNSISLIAKNIKAEKGGFSFEIDKHNMVTPLLGEHNIANVVAAIAPARAFLCDWDKIAKVLKNIHSIPGRFERIENNKGLNVIVDYAFEPVALDALYQTIKNIPHKKIIHVCGATGGGRDKARREPIGAYVGNHADIFIVTDEDPYEENPEEIMEQVAKGAVRAGKKLNKDLFKILDRKKAIQKAVHLAEKGDIILVTGKGSEQGMCVANNKIVPWDDRATVRSCLI